MGRILSVVFLLFSTLGWAQSNSEQYPVNIHVVSSEWFVAPTTLGPIATQRLKVVIDGKKFDLETAAKGRITLLALGDYKAKLIEDVHKSTYESSQTYEVRFPDGKTKKFDVIGQTE